MQVPIYISISIYLYKHITRNCTGQPSFCLVSSIAFAFAKLISPRLSPFSKLMTHVISTRPSRPLSIHR